MTVVLVTCGDGGTGRAIAEELADRDVDVILTARGKDAARSASEHLWDEGLDTAHPRVLDPARPATITKLTETLAREFGALDGLVLCGLDEEETAAVRDGLRHVLRADARIVCADGGEPDAVVRELELG